MEFPKIVKSLENKEPLFIEKLFSWILKNEELFSTYNISEVSELAGLYSKVLIPKFAENKNISLKKAQLKVASEMSYSWPEIAEVENPAVTGSITWTKSDLVTVSRQPQYVEAINVTSKSPGAKVFVGFSLVEVFPSPKDHT